MAKKILTDDGEIIDAPVMASTPVFFKTPWNHDTDQESALATSSPGEKTLTQQHLARDTETAVILQKFMNTGTDLSTLGTPNYVDIEDKGDLQDQMVTSWEVEQAWGELSPEVRNTLKDPQTFVNYVQHCLQTGDLDPLRQMGLANRFEELPVKTTEKVAETTSSTAGTPAAGGGKAAPAA